MELKKGYKQTEVGLIPEDWDVVKMSAIGETFIGLTYSPNNVSESGILVLRSSNVQNMKLAFNDNVYVEMEIPDRAIVREDDLLICVRNGSKQLIGKCALIDNKTSSSAFGAFMSIYRSKHNRFIFYQFQSNLIQRQINETLGATINQLTNKDLSVFRIVKPRNEQEEDRISTILSDVDAYITSVEKLIEKKKAIKQGAMQELFKPKYGWELTNLGDLVEIKKGQLITDTTKIDGNIPVIAGGKKPAYFHNKPNREKNIITISGSGASAGYVSFHDYPIFASDCSTIEENKKISIHFIYYFLKLNQEKIYKMQTGGAQPHIHPSDLKPMQIAIPSKDIQLSIANILIEMDKEVSILEFKLDKVNRIKQGMMQNLLTGKIRII
jgi:type I restriction enzyme S subunit